MEFTNEITKMISMAGTIILTDQEKDILFAPVDESLVEIRPDGLIYLPWMEYVRRLREAFGIGWALIPQGMPKIKDTYITWGFWLVIRGVLCGFAIGEQEWRIDNATMSGTDACEGAKSNALMRLLKGIGICIELWQPSFVRSWKTKHAVKIPDPNPKHKDKEIWVRNEVTFPSAPNSSPVGVVVDVPAEEVRASLEGPTEDPREEVSARRYVTFQTEIMQQKTIPTLRDWWNINSTVAVVELIDKHYKMLEDLKNKMRSNMLQKAKEAR
jgi:hypothetical protein